MRRIRCRLLVFLLLPSLPCVSFGQGCSDAGFCTLNSFKPHSIDSIIEISNQFKVGLFYGSADYSIAVYGSYIEYNRILKNGISIDVKTTTLAQKGNKEMLRFHLAVGGSTGKALAPASAHPARGAGRPRR